MKTVSDLTNLTQGSKILVSYKPWCYDCLNQFTKGRLDPFFEHMPLPENRNIFFCFKKKHEFTELKF